MIIIVVLGRLIIRMFCEQKKNADEKEFVIRICMIVKNKEKEEEVAVVLAQVDLSI